MKNNKASNLILLGGPGSGKGTQAKRIADTLKILHLSTGELFRENIRRKTDLGKLANIYIEKGDLVPDDVTVAMVKERLNNPDTLPGVIFDGFPRTISQANSLNDLLVSINRKISRVIYIKVDNDEIVHRLSQRYICRDCQTPYSLLGNQPTNSWECDNCGGVLYQREDDKPETVRARIETYHTQTAPLIEFYQKNGLLSEVDGLGNIEEITDRILAIINFPVHHSD